MSDFVTKAQVTQTGQVLSLTTDSTPQAGDFIIAVIGNFGGFDEVMASGSTSGWTVLVGGEVNGSSVHVLYKFASAGGAQSISFTMGAVSSFTRTLAVNVFRYVSTSSTLNASSGPATVFNQTFVSFGQPSTSLNGCMVVRVLGCQPSGSAVVFSIGGGSTLAAGFTESNNGRIITSYETQAVAGAVSAATATATLNSDLRAWVFAFKPDQPPSAPSGIGLSPLPIDTTGTLSFTRGTDPEGADVFTEVEFSTNNGADYSPFAMSAANANSIAVNFSGVAAGTQTKLRLRSVAGGLTSTWVEFGPFTVQHAPSAPAWVFPAAGSSHVIGRNKTLDWADAFDPDTPAGSITYQVQISTAGSGGPFTSLPGSPTAAGVTQLVYNFAGLSPGSNNYLRVRGNDGTNDGAWSVLGPLTTVADVAPSAPSPVTFTQGGVSISGNFDRAAALIVGWTFNDPSDVQQDYEVDASTDGGGTWPITSGIITSASQSHTFAAGVFSAVPAGTVVTFRVRTRDGGNNWSTHAQNTITARVKPTVTITSPTAGGTVGDALPTFTWTPSAQDAYEIALLSPSDVPEWTPPELASGATSRVSGISLQNSSQHKLRLRVKKDGIYSDYVIHSFTVAFTQPAVPTVVATADADNGWILVAVTNPTPTGGQPAVDHNEIWAFETALGAAHAYMIADDVENNGTFEYRLAASGVEYGFYAIAIATNGLPTQGTADTETLIINPEDLWLMDVNDPLGMFRVLPEDIQESGELGGATVFVDGSELPLDFFDETYNHRLTYRTRAFEGTDERKNLMNLYRSRSTICIRDGWQKTFCSWRSFSAAYTVGGPDVIISVQEVRFIEALNTVDAGPPFVRITEGGEIRITEY